MEGRRGRLRHRAGTCPFPAQPTPAPGAAGRISPSLQGRVPPASLPASLAHGSDAVKSNKGIETGRGSSQGPSETVGHEASCPKGTGHVVSHGPIPVRRRKSQAVQRGQCNGVPGWGQAEQPDPACSPPPASTQQGLGLWLFHALPTGQGEMGESGISWNKALGG